MSSAMSKKKQRKDKVPREQLNPRVLLDASLSAKLRVLYTQFQNADTHRFRNVESVDAALTTSELTSEDILVVCSLISAQDKHDIVPQMTSVGAVDVFKRIFKGARGYESISKFGGPDDPLLQMTSFKYVIEAVLCHKKRDATKLRNAHDVDHKNKHASAFEYANEIFSFPPALDSKKRASRNSKLCRKVVEFGRKEWGVLGKRARSNSNTFSMSVWLASKGQPEDTQARDSLLHLHERIFAALPSELRFDESLLA